MQAFDRVNGRPTSVEARGQQQATKRTAGHNRQRGSGQGPRTSVEAVRFANVKVVLTKHGKRFGVGVDLRQGYVWTVL